MPFDEIFPPQLQASNGQQNNCHRQCKCMGEPLLLDVLTQWGQNDFEYYSNRNENDMGKFLSLAICICDLKAPLRVTIANKSANLVKLKSKFKNYLAPLCLYTVNNALFTT